MENSFSFSPQMQNASSAPGMYLPVFIPLPPAQISYIQVPQHNILDSTLHVIPPDIRLVQVAQTVQPNNLPSTGTYYTIPNNQVTHMTMLGPQVQQPLAQKDMPLVTQYVIRPVYTCRSTDGEPVPKEENIKYPTSISSPPFLTIQPKTTCLLKDGNISIQPRQLIRPEVKKEVINYNKDCLQPAKATTVNLRTDTCPQKKPTAENTSDKTPMVPTQNNHGQALRSNLDNHACKPEPVDEKIPVVKDNFQILTSPSAGFIGGETTVTNEASGAILDTKLDQSKLVLDSEVANKCSAPPEGILAEEIQRQDVSMDTQHAVTGCNSDREQVAASSDYIEEEFMMMTYSKPCYNTKGPNLSPEENVDQRMKPDENEDSVSCSVQDPDVSLKSDTPEDSADQEPEEHTPLSNQHNTSDAKLQAKCFVVLKRLQLPHLTPHSINIKYLIKNSENRDKSNNGGRLRRNSAKRWFPCENYVENPENEETSLSSREKRDRSCKKPQKRHFTWCLRSKLEMSSNESEGVRTSQENEPVDGREDISWSQPTLSRLKQQMEQQLAAVQLICHNSDC